MNQKNITKKIWSTAIESKTLITGQKTSKQIMPGHTKHRLSANKEISGILNKSWSCKY